MSIIPNVYSALQMRELAPMQKFPSLFTQRVTQAAYFYKKQSLAGEQVVEQIRDTRFRKLAEATTVYGKTALRNTVKVIKYKVVLPNMLGFPVIFISSTLRDINSPVSTALSVPNFTSRALNAMKEIKATEVLQEGINVIERPNADGFSTKIYINKYLA